MRSARAFVLLEVLVALVILGVTFVAVLRGFTIALDTLRRNETLERAMYLADSIMDDFILEPPGEDPVRGEFSEDPRFGEEYADFSFEAEFEEEDVDYSEKPTGKPRQDFESIIRIDLRIIHKTKQGPRTVVRLTTYALEPTLYSPDALQTNQLF